MSKGADFEREILKTLSLWWTQDENDPREDIFYRTSGSGARSTARAKKGKATHNSSGDVGYLDAIGKPLIDYAFIEIKRGYTSIGRVNESDIKSILHSAPTVRLHEFLAKYIRNKIKKSGNTIDALDFVDSKSCLLMDWWKKAREQNKMSDTEMIIFKRDMKSIAIMLTEFSWEELSSNPFKLNHITLNYFDVVDENIKLIPFDVFLETVHPDKIRKLTNELGNPVI
uniref:Uncharacterized protein n=1 Tax=viral metagenome TaxID=1070528 RepID=A0A6M3IVU9_9ZZZZ